uniref:Uncharacterized protein n=1 Tax=Glossina brevipalpis TaxID=37001 RepID=A0A1A9WYY7_9MUSC
MTVPRSRSLERYPTPSSRQNVPSDSKPRQNAPTDPKPYNGTPRPRGYSEPPTGVIETFDPQYRSRSLEGEFYRYPYRSPRPYDIRQQRLAGRYHELRVIDEASRRPPDNELDLLRMLQLIGIGIALGIILLGFLQKK